MVSVQQALEGLRDNIATVIAEQEVWDSLHDVKKALGLPNEENPNNLGKQRYLRKVTSAATDQEIIQAARQIINSYPGTRGKPSSTILQQIQDHLWWIESQGVQQITNVTRYKFAEGLEGVQFWGRLSLRDFFASIIPSELNEIRLHELIIGRDGQIYREQLDISAIFKTREESSKPSLSTSVGPFPFGADSYKYSLVGSANLLRQLELIKWADQRFCLLVERMVHPEVQPPSKQQSLVARFNPWLQQDGFELREEGRQGGLPVYKVRRRTAGVSGTPKYIIFASVGSKPDIVIDDAVNMDIRVVRHAEQCLVYDQPPPGGDLTWKMLVEWWSKREGLNSADQAIRRKFGGRLRNSLQSEPERIFFDTYFKVFKPLLGDDLPALLPQVYLHYDPRKQSERATPILARQRMDFLMLLRDANRIVIEIDGIHHYSDENGYASPSRYAAMVAEDRRIRSLGYEVYRFGGAEFTDPELARKNIASFFSELLRNHGFQSV